MTTQTQAVQQRGPDWSALARDTGYTVEQLQLLKSTVVDSEVSIPEFALFMTIAKSVRLDPFRRQIYAISRYDNKAGRKVMRTQTSIDGFRAVAARNEKYTGQVGPFWCGPDGIWRDVWLEDAQPSAAKVGVLIGSNEEPIWGVARWRSYVQTDRNGNPTKFWEQMGPEMLAKCAEALALRRALPEDLSGLYTGDEMQQADSPTTVTVAPVQQQSTAERIAERVEQDQRAAPVEPEVLPPEDPPEPSKRSRKPQGAPEPEQAPEPAPEPPRAEEEQQAPPELPFGQDEPDAPPADSEPGSMTLYEEHPELYVDNPEGMERYLSWPHASLAVGEHFYDWCDNPLAEKGRLASYTAWNLIDGPQGGGRHKLAAAVVQATAKKYGPATAPEAALRLDWCLGLMLRRYAWEHRNKAKSTAEDKSASAG